MDYNAALTDVEYLMHINIYEIICKNHVQSMYNMFLFS